MQLPRKSFLILPLLYVAVAPAPAAAQTAADAMFAVNNTWMLVATLLVFMMHLGFAFLEAGLTQSKNTVNILFKNVSIIAIGLLTYAIVGFNLMYPGEFSMGGFFGFAGFGIGTDAAGLTSEYSEGYTYWTDFIFQAMFAATAATIVSGAVAERIKLASFLVFATLYVGLVYPLVGSWKWGGGWLDEMGFYDFAGSTLVHSVGGWAALAGVIVLDDGDCIVRVAKNINEFFHEESCGKCTPCREGLDWTGKILHRLEAGEGRQGDLEQLDFLCGSIFGNSFCALGDGAAWALKAAITQFRDEFVQHIEEGKCPHS
ncbi:MAG: hypothetical protein IIC04_09075 [Proteobacteria bacterium]|nr:hypothetical protein [Pseudomonadota bacterium]